MGNKPQKQGPPPEHGTYGPGETSRNCLVTIILTQVNYVNNGNSPVGAKLHANIEGQDIEDSRTIEAGGTISFPLWYRESRRNRCGTDVEVRYVLDVSVSPAAEISPLDVHLAETKTYPCPSFKDHEVFKLTAGDPKDLFVTFEFVFRVELECREA
ncbi:MAG TPA: hypothetical protein VJT71_15205 [Pyrinomonadaceae bacterium]|nr:hypothetical protein [Pyrinomonadaceae bacterium]